MRLNVNTKVIGNNVILVPYREYHVPKYHEWMKSKELQALTASEPLSLEHEYNMQKTWCEDNDKCTFIILDLSRWEESCNEIDSMIGDTNIFITDKDQMVGEIEIMIAEEFARRKKRGWEAVILMLLYGIKYVGIKTFQAKINLDNKISISLFKKLGFYEKSKSEVFNEITLEKAVEDTWFKQLESYCILQINVYK